MTRKRSSVTKGSRRGNIKLIKADDRPLTVQRPELLVGGTDRDFRRLVNALLPFLTLHSAIRNGYAELLGLTGPSYSILLCIRTLGDHGSVNVRTIADQLRLSGSFVTAETNQLERKGLVNKRRSQSDKRLVAVTLTPRAVALLDSIASLRQRVNDVQFGCLNQQEFKMLVPLIERLVQSGESALALLDFLTRQELGKAESNSASGREGKNSSARVAR